MGMGKGLLTHSGAGGKGLTVHDALANPLACLHAPPPCCSCVDWGMSHTATSPALPSPTATGNIPPLTSGTSGDWACGSANPRALLHGGGESTTAGDPGEGRVLWWGDWPPPAQPTLGDQYGWDQGSSRGNTRAQKGDLPLVSGELLGCWKGIRKCKGV